MSQDPTADLVRRMVEGFAKDVEAIQAGVIDGRVPDSARLVLAAALIYVVEPADLVPDRLQGLGLLDDAALLRLAAEAAVAAGAGDPELQRLAAEAGELGLVLGDLVEPLSRHLEGLTGPDARGETPADVIAHPERRMQLWKELNERRDAARTHAMVATAVDAGGLVKTLQGLLRTRLAKKA